MKIIDKGEYTFLGAEEEPKKQNTSDKRWDKFKEKIVWVTEEVGKWIRTRRWSRWNKN